MAPGYGPGAGAPADPGGGGEVAGAGAFPPGGGPDESGVPPGRPDRLAPPAAPAAPKPGGFVASTTPFEIPSELPETRPDVAVIADADVRGVEIRGDIVGTPVPGDDRPPTGVTTPAPGDGPVAIDAVEVRPSFRDGDEIARLVRRLSPPRLRESGVTGEVLLRFVINPEGRVEPGSIEVVSASHPAFGEAAREAAERFRFTPVSVGGQGVRVVTTMPIRWALED